jgi:hypothetical protein
VASRNTFEVNNPLSSPPTRYQIVAGMLLRLIAPITAKISVIKAAVLNLSSNRGFTVPVKMVLSKRWLATIHIMKMA